jgi:hypothetical protein
MISTFIFSILFLSNIHFSYQQTLNGCQASTVSTTTSSRPSSPTTATRASICITSSDTYYYGGDILRGLTNIANYVDCCNLCGSNSRCTAFSYDPNNKSCFLKNINPSNARTQSMSGFVSGYVFARK